MNLNTSGVTSRTARLQERLASIGTVLRRHRVLAVVVALVLVSAAAWAASLATNNTNSPLMGQTSSGGGANGGAADAADRDGATEALAAPESAGEAGAADGAEQAAPSAGGGSANQGLSGPMIIRRGALDLAVESVDDSFAAVRQVASTAGGFVAESSLHTRPEDDGGPQSAYVTMRVPAERFDEVVQQLRQLAVEVRSISDRAEDVSGEFTDLQATLRNLTAVESQYIELLGRANEIGAVLQVQDRLNEVRLQIERTQGRIQMLEELSSMATIEVSLRDEAAAPLVTHDGPLGAARAAWEASLNTIEGIATVLVAAVVYSWWLAPPVIVVLWLLMRTRREREAAVAD